MTVYDREHRAEKVQRDLGADPEKGHGNEGDKEARVHLARKLSRPSTTLNMARTYVVVHIRIVLVPVVAIVACEEVELVLLAFLVAGIAGQLRVVLVVFRHDGRVKNTP